MSTPTVRAKLSVGSVKRVADGTGVITQEEISLHAAYTGSDENKQWSKWTPSAQFTMTISNPEAFGKFLPGQFYFVDFTPTDVKGI